MSIACHYANFLRREASRADAHARPIQAAALRASADKLVALAAENERLRAELAESATDLSRVLETVKYLSGIAERGESRKIDESEPVEQFVLGYVKKLEAEIERLRAELGVMSAANSKILEENKELSVAAIESRLELAALRKQEPVAYARQLDSPHPKVVSDLRYRPSNVDPIEYAPLYLGVGAQGWNKPRAGLLSAAAGAQPATPSTQITPNWIWSWLMDWCKRRGVPPSNYDSLFQMASDAHLLAAGGPSAPSVPAEYVTDATHEKVMDAIAAALGDAYDCRRVWGAWSYGTMSQDDFVQVVEQQDRLAEIADAAIRAMLASGAQPAPSVPGRATMIERLKAAVEGECDGLAVDDRHAEAILDYVLAAAPEAPKSRPLTDAMVEAAGRALSDRHASGCGCGMDKDIMWGSYSDEFKEQARVALGAAHGIKENSND